MDRGRQIGIAQGTGGRAGGLLAAMVLLLLAVVVAVPLLVLIMGAGLALWAWAALRAVAAKLRGDGRRNVRVVGPRE